MNFKLLLIFFKTKNFKFSIVALTASLLLWFTINLSKDYSKMVSVNIEFENVIEGNLLKCKDSVIFVKLNGSGFSLLSSDFSNLKYKIDISEQPSEWDWYQNKYNFNQIFPKSTAVLSVEPSRITYSQQKLFSKKLPIINKIEVHPKLGYGLTNSNIKPDSILIYGYEKDIADLKYITTSALEFDEITDSIIGSVDLMLGENAIRSNVDKISYTYAVERFTQGDFTIPIQLINIPEDLDISIFPKQVNVQFEAPLSLYKNYSPADFSLTVDCSKISEEKQLIINKERIPKGMTNVRLLKKTVTFLVMNK